jgi:superfamily I DNA/RNA helicase
LTAKQQLELFLENVMLLNDEDNIEHIEDGKLIIKNSTQVDQTSPSRVNLMTIHAAKGLEFETVLLCGCEEGGTLQCVANK